MTSEVIAPLPRREDAGAMVTSTEHHDARARPHAELIARRAADRLRRALRLNAAFSTISGTVLLVAAEPVAEVLGVGDVAVVRATGALLIGFAGAVLVVASLRPSLLERFGLLVSIADVGWVVATVGTVALGWFSATGAALAGGVGLVVGGLAVVQLRARHGLRRAAGPTNAGPDGSLPVARSEPGGAR